MSTPIQANSPIGGQLISSFGGVLGFTPFGLGSPANYSSGSVEPSVSNQSVLDARRWDLLLHSFGDDSTDTSSYGAEGYQKTAEGFMLAASILWDLRRPPDLISKNGGNIAIDNINAGFQLWAYLGDDANYPSDIGAQYYFAPSAKIVMQKPIIDAGTKAMIGIDVVIKGNSRIYKLPAELTQFGKYMTHLKNRNFVF